MSENDDNKRVLLLYSGGMDSTVLLHLGKSLGYTIHALGVDYGQKNIRELTVARQWCDKLEIPFAVMSLPIYQDIASGLTGTNELGKYGTPNPYYVPGRNTVFIALAAAKAESHGIRRVWYGPTDTSRNPDKTQKYIRAMNEVLAQSASFPIELEAPLLGMRKDLIHAMAAGFGFTINDTHSGYKV